MPWRRYSGVPWFASGRSWQTYDLIYRVPFYAIDYALASICALQILAMNQRDPAKTINTVRVLCSLGGSLPFRQLLSKVGLSSPFDPGVVARSMAGVAEALDL